MRCTHVLPLHFDQNEAMLTLLCSYGTHIIARETSGVHQVMALKLSFSSKSDRMAFGGELDAELSGTGALQGSLKGGFDATRRKSKEKATVEVSTIGKGLKHVPQCASSLVSLPSRHSLHEKHCSDGLRLGPVFCSGAFELLALFKCSLKPPTAHLYTFVNISLHEHDAGGA
jgi:hypothetical protein